MQVLKFVHDRNVIHRDLKPSNIMRRLADRKIVLIDFGAVKEVIQSPEAASNQQGFAVNPTVVIGTHGYSAPEQMMGQPRLSSDIHAVGMIGIEALTGMSILELGNLRDEYTHEILWQQKVHVSDAFANVLNKMICYNFRDRYQNATEALRALEALDSSQATLHRATTLLTSPISQGTTHVEPQSQVNATNRTSQSWNTPTVTDSQVMASSYPSGVQYTAQPQQPQKWKWILAGLVMLMGVSIGVGITGTLFVQSLLTNRGNQNPQNTAQDSINSAPSIQEESPPYSPSPASPTASSPYPSSSLSPAATTTEPVVTQSEAPTIDLQPLQAALQSQQYSTANELTNKMIYDLMKGDPSVLAAEQIPCSPLLAINDLWQQYSNGRFSFGTQAKIWQQIASTRKNVKDAFIEFKQKLDWQTPISMTTIGDKELNQITYSSVAPEGHIPFLSHIIPTSGLQNINVYIRGENPLLPYILQRFSYCQTQQQPASTPVSSPQAQTRN
ncbi:GUN4 domain-containing protein [Thermosynechococcus sp. HN-54]|uniref:GUN4 domain-containing protein n=1 Tax=Thermosynechococcus sp. HN-54 TaxID=2933959 RepID=UPI00202CD891|nr:GUN4 domain-containing protein [Thermosynechococcus sp. HN-54]URR34455.1 GUN4 domain-containing protein [Thermosynechococcus sp. HN-54]